MIFLILQFLWKYVDDLMGKGLEWYTIAELLFYASANLVPMALPLAILLSSIMTFGNLAENSELTAMKSAGMSLMKIMRPLTVFIIFVSFGAFIFANYIFPVANMKFRSLIFDIQRQKPTLTIKQGTFYNDIEGFSIYVEEKSADGNTLSDILIYDHTKMSSKYKRSIVAEKGKISQTKDSHYMIFHLTDGNVYQEIEPGEVNGKAFGFQNLKFKEGDFNFDLSDFELERTNVDAFKDHYEMLNLSQLESQEDTLKIKLVFRIKEFKDVVLKRFLPYRNAAAADLKSLSGVNLTFDQLPEHIQRQRLTEALNNASNLKKTGSDYEANYYGAIENIARHRLEWHRKFTLSIACIILFFIGAPLGAIIRKGGLGAPIVASIILFIFYYILSIAGEKMSKSGVMDPFWGMWLSSFILFPVGFFLTYKSNNDSTLFDKDFYIKLFRRKRQVKS